MFGAGASIGFPATNRSREYTPETLQTWNVIPNQTALPEREAVRAIHIYDFDNTLFLTPLPNGKIWHAPTLGNLHSPIWLANGGWWHDSRILAATGAGLEEEERRAWEGWWNEHIVQLVQLSMQQKDALAVLLTGRSVKGFGPLLTRILKSKGLEFDMIVLKPEVMPSGHEPETTMAFKTVFMEEVLNTYLEAQDLRIYEDRVKHVRAFEEFCHNYIQATLNRRAHLKAEVIQVAEAARCLDPITELSVIQTMVHEHNSVQRTIHGHRFLPLRIKKTVFYTGYLLSSSTSANLLNTLEIPSMIAKENDVKLLANNVMITPRPASRSVLARTGPLGRKVEFEVVGVAHWEHKVWAALVKPVDNSIRIYTDNPEPTVVLAVRRGAKPIDAGRIDKSHYKPPAKPVRFWTVVGERLLLRIEEDNNEGEWESLFPRRKSAIPASAAASAQTPPLVRAIPSWGGGGRW
ncbi:hypothetical protein FN846DRAFT_777559 [Sphaerosporella brunnea]|uniref:Swiss Army Knife RNA repair protein HAD domain-containing protein n=1 Tax=Sphaerosporella brunnea TaxID=1250544 RepID=A0A5J5EYK8_9PEZI|nr:hypothetical protein FN846DRAFT_777559 [Sphaerosporella brunnea]